MAQKVEIGQAAKYTILFLHLLNVDTSYVMIVTTKPNHSHIKIINITRNRYVLII